MPNYVTWEQVAGYFDGDGTIAISDLTNQPYKLSLSLIFVDQSIDQIVMVRSFLRNKGLRTSNVLKTSKASAFMVAVSEFNSVKEVLKRMAPLLCKKANEAVACIDYYEGRTTGNELLTLFKNEVEAGRRERRPRKVPINVPYTYPQGHSLMMTRWRQRKRDVMFRTRAKVTQEDYDAIRAEHFKLGKGVMELVRSHPQYSRETIRRILGKGRGYVLVKDEGLVQSTDSR